MAKAKPKAEEDFEVVGDLDPAEEAKVAAAAAVEEKKTLVNDLRTALTEAETSLAEAESVHAEATAPPPVVGPRVKLEHSGEVLAVAPGEERERRLLIAGINYEHVSDAVDQGETIWVYRAM